MGIFNNKNDRYPIYYEEEDVVTEAGDHDEEDDEALLRLATPNTFEFNTMAATLDLPKRKPKRGKKPAVKKSSNPFAPLSTDGSPETDIDLSMLFSDTTTTAAQRDEDDVDLQKALQMSRTLMLQVNDEDDEELQRALLLSTMESSNGGVVREEFAELLQNDVEIGSDLGVLVNPNSGDLGEFDWKMKGACRLPEMKPIDNKNLRLQLGEASTSVCAVCSDELPTGKMTRLSDCGHFFCKDCLGEYLGKAIKETIYLEDQKCPGAKCKFTLPWLRCLSNLPPEVAERRNEAAEETKALKKLIEKEARESFHEMMEYREWQHRNDMRMMNGHHRGMKGRRRQMDRHRRDPRMMMMNGRYHRMIMDEHNDHMEDYHRMMGEHHPEMENYRNPWRFADEEHMMQERFRYGGRERYDSGGED